MVSLSIGIIVELHLGSVLAQYFNVDLIPRIVLRRAGVRKERGYHTVVFDCLHGGFVVAVGIVVIGAVLTARIIILACGILVDAQVQCAVLHHGIFRIPSAVKRIAVRPAVRRKEQRRFSRTEICNGIGGGVHRCAVVRNPRSAAICCEVTKHCQIQTIQHAISIYIRSRHAIQFCTQQVPLHLPDIPAVTNAVPVHIASYVLLLRKNSRKSSCCANSQHNRQRNCHSAHSISSHRNSLLKNHHLVQKMFHVSNEFKTIIPLPRQNAYCNHDKNSNFLT